MQNLDNCLPLGNHRASSDCPHLNGNFVAIDFEISGDFASGDFREWTDDEGEEDDIMKEKDDIEDDDEDEEDDDDDDGDDNDGYI